MCKDTVASVVIRECQMCHKRLLAKHVRTLCDWKYRVNYDGSIFEWRAFDMNVCMECWFIHSVNIDGGFYVCRREVDYV